MTARELAMAFTGGRSFHLLGHRVTEVRATRRTVAIVARGVTTIVPLDDEVTALLVADEEGDDDE